MIVYLPRDIGSGTQTSFWEEHLARGRSLKNLYPGLYRLVVEREMLLRDSVRRNSGGPVWNVR